MYTSECRTITNVNTIERGRYRRRIFLLRLQIAINKNWNLKQIAVPNNFNTFNFKNKMRKTREKERERRFIKKETLERKQIQVQIISLIMIF